MNAARLQQPLLERKDHVRGQEGGTKDAPIVDLNVAQEPGRRLALPGKLVQLDEEVPVRIASFACPYTPGARRHHSAAAGC